MYQYFEGICCHFLQGRVYLVDCAVILVPVLLAVCQIWFFRTQLVTLPWRFTRDVPPPCKSHFVDLFLLSSFVQSVLVNSLFILRSSTPQINHSFVHSFTHSFTHSFIHSFCSVLQQDHSLFQSQISTECDLMPPL